MKKQSIPWYRKGLKDGVPIGLGYFAVSFALGIAASQAGLTPLQAALTSALCNASAGEYAGFTVIAAQAGYLEMAVMTLIVNARYLLMSAALAQKFPEKAPFYHRLLVGYAVTDEIFGASVVVPGQLQPFYNYGLASSALSMWALGTFCGAAMGNILPPQVVSALGVGLYGMFLAIIIPPARKNLVVRGLVFLSMAASFACSLLPGISKLSEGSRIILLTVLISLGAAVCFPVDPQEDLVTEEEIGEA